MHSHAWQVGREAQLTRDVRKRGREVRIVSIGPSRGGRDAAAIRQRGQRRLGLVEMAQLPKQRAQRLLERAMIGERLQHGRAQFADRHADRGGFQRTRQRRVERAAAARAADALGDRTQLDAESDVGAADFGERLPQRRGDVRARRHHRHRRQRVTVLLTANHVLEPAPAMRSGPHERDAVKRPRGLCGGHAEA